MTIRKSLPGSTQVRILNSLGIKWEQKFLQFLACCPLVGQLASEPSLDLKLVFQQPQTIDSPSEGLVNYRKIANISDVSLIRKSTYCVVRRVSK